MRVSVVLALVAIISCGEPARTTAPAPNGAPNPAAAPTTAAPTLTPHPQLARAVREVEVPACTFAPDQKPDGAAPAHRVFLLDDGVARDDPDPRAAPCRVPDLEHPTVYLFPVADFERALAGTEKELATLADLVTRRPARPDADPPFIPFVDASMAYVERVRYVDFADGAGILFLTELVIEPDTLVKTPIYVFQGLSRDRRQFVLGVFPVVTKVAVPAFTWPSDDIAVATASHEPYRRQVSAALAAADESAFTPRADWIADTMASLVIAPGVGRR